MPVDIVYETHSISTDNEAGIAAAVTVWSAIPPGGYRRRSD
jgi:hypothetical protein